MPTFGAGTANVYFMITAVMAIKIAMMVATKAIVVRKFMCMVLANSPTIVEMCILLKPH